METLDKKAFGISGQGNGALSPIKTTMDNVSKTGCPPTMVSAQNSPDADVNTQKPLSDKDKVAWYPMRIAYTQDSVAIKIRDFLKDEKGIEVFLPVEEKVTLRSGKRFRRLAPMFNSLIFIRNTQNEITRLKRSNRELLSLRYYIRHHSNDTPPEIIYIPDEQMKQFMKVASREDGSVMPLGNKDFTHKPGRKVRVIGGIFKGVEGKVCRVKKDRRVVVTLEGVCSVAISCISPDLLEDIQDE